MAARGAPEVQAAQHALRAISTGAGLQEWTPLSGSQDDKHTRDFSGLTAWQRAALKGGKRRFRGGGHNQYNSVLLCIDCS